MQRPTCRATYEIHCCECSLRHPEASLRNSSGGSYFHHLKLCLIRFHRPGALPSWLSDQDLSKSAKAFEKSGFTGPLNWYRNLDRNRELLAFLAHSKIEQPSIFLAGSEDAVISMYRSAFDELEETMPRLHTKLLVPGAGHWIQQERPAEVNRSLLSFLAR